MSEMTKRMMDLINRYADEYGVFPYFFDSKIDLDELSIKFEIAPADVIRGICTEHDGTKCLILADEKEMENFRNDQQEKMNELLRYVQSLL